MIPRRRKRSKMGVRTEARIRCPGHLSWTRGLVCLAAGRDPEPCYGRMEAHHVSEDGNAGMGIKAPDTDVVPFCEFHHARGHRTGWKRYAAEVLRLNLMDCAADIWRRSPHRAKLEK